MTREEVAAIEVGKTKITPALARVLTGFFLILIATIPIVEQLGLEESNQENRSTLMEDFAELYPSPSEVFDADESDGIVSAIYKTNAEILKKINTLESNLEDNSPVSRRIIPHMQRLLVEGLHAGTESVYIGKDHWLFYRPAMDSLWGGGFLEEDILDKRRRRGDEYTKAPQPDPRKAIFEFHEHLEKRGIELLIVPAPAKASIHPEQFTSGISDTQLVQNSDYQLFIEGLKEMGILVCDLDSEMRAAKEIAPQFLKTDTHWTPLGAKVAANSISKLIDQSIALGKLQTQEFSHRTKTITNTGDIAAMLKIPESKSPYAYETVDIDVVLNSDGSPWRSDPNAEILLLGDSFSNIFNLEAMGWGESAGLPAQLSYNLQRPIETILRNDAGAFATREQLSNDLARGIDRLEGKKVVIWEFASRELALGNWKTGLSLDLGKKRSTDKMTTREFQVRGRIANLTRPPKPGSVPYKDCVIALHLNEVETILESKRLKDIVVFTLGMRDNQWLSPSTFKLGQEVTLNLTRWENVAITYESLNRVELTDDSTVLLDIFWLADQDVAAAPVTTQIDSSRQSAPTSLATVSNLPDSLWKDELITRVDKLSRESQTVHVGSDDWLFFLPELRHLSVGEFWGQRAAKVSKANDLEYADPLPAILDFQKQLQAKGIELILMPVPPKASVLPDKVFGSLLEGAREATQSETAVLKGWYDRLRKEGIPVVDLLDPFVELADQRDDFYCKLDTHWNGHACIEAADLVAQALWEAVDFSDVKARDYHVDESSVTISGDLAASINSDQTERVYTERVWERTSGGYQAPGTWRESPVLLLADSHGLVFHAGGDMFDSQAGLADHLAKNLGFPVDLVAVRGSGATPARMNLLRRGDNLAGKRAVVWAFTAREFTESVVGWRKLPVVQSNSSNPVQTQDSDFSSDSMPVEISGEQSMEEDHFEGSAWNFEEATRPIRVFDSIGEALQDIFLTPSGFAHHSNTGWMVIHEGSFLEKSGAPFLSKALEMGKAISIESVIQPFNQTQTRAAIVSVGGSYFLMQEKDHVVFIFSTSSGIHKMPIQLPPGIKPIHLVVTYGPDLGFHAYVNGVPQHPSGQILGELIPSKVDRIVFGNSPNQDRSWSGRIKHTAIYAKETDHSRATSLFARASDALTQENEGGYLHLTAFLNAKSHIPTLEELAPYTENLTVFEYQVQRIISGTYKEETIYVAHWAILDSQHIPWMSSVEQGEEVELILQAFQGNPALEAVNLSDTIISDFTLPLFYDAGGLVFETSIASDLFSTSSEDPVSFTRTEVAKSIYGPGSKQESIQRQVRVDQNLKELNEVVQAYGGYEYWATQLQPYRERLFNKYRDLAQPYIEFGEGHFSSRAQVDYLLIDSSYPKFSSADWHDGTLAEQSIVHFSKQLEELGMDLILMPIPTQSDLYPERFAATTGLTHPNPERTKLMQNLMQAGVEVLDLVPVFKGYNSPDPLFIPTDIHWNTPAIRLAAAELAKRLKNYDSVKSYQTDQAPFTTKTDRISYKNGSFLRNANETLRNSSTGNPMVLRDTIRASSGAIYDDYDSKTPVLIIGDSFAHIFAYTGGDLAGQLARDLGIPVARISKGGAGPYAPRLFASQTSGQMESRRVIIWAFSSEFLFSRESQWSIITLDPPEQ